MHLYSNVNKIFLTLSISDRTRANAKGKSPLIKLAMLPTSKYGHSVLFSFTIRSQEAGETSSSKTLSFSSLSFLLSYKIVKIKGSVSQLIHII